MVISMTRWGIFLLIMAINVLVSVICFIVMMIIAGTDKKLTIQRFLIMLFCPVVGPLFYGVAWLMYKLFFSKQADLSDVVFSKERVETTVRADEDAGRNLVPVEEAMDVTGTTDLRQLVMNIAKTDINQSLSAVSMALNSEDSETAHYAASVLQEALNDFRVRIQENHRKVRSGDDDAVEIAEEMIPVMNNLLRQKVLSESEQRDFVNIMDEFAELVFTEEKEKLQPVHFEQMILRALDIEDYNKCAKWCGRLTAQYPDELCSYTCRLKYYYNSGQNENFFKTMADLKKSAVVIDRETLDLIRSFS